MNKDVSNSFESHFGIVSDPRIDRSKLYPLTEILFVVLSGSICGAESWRDYVLFGKEKLDFMRQYYPFENGIPSKNTFARVLAALDTESFKRCFIEWVKSLQAVLGDVIEIDGGQHMDAVEYDTLRTKDLENRGYRVLRIWNHEVFKNIQGVMDGILNLLDTLPHQTPSSPTLLPQGRREKILPTD